MYNGHMYTDTMLHMDASDAINFPLYMEGRGEESEYWSGDKAHAFWLLWHRTDVEALREFLREHFQLDPGVDPIHLGDLRITPEMLREIEARKIWPYIVRQQIGQAVIIPALTPHYISPTTPSLLVSLIWLLFRF